MKTFLFSLLFVAASLATVTADAPAPTPLATATGDQAQRFERFKAAMEQLNLTDAQKTQIKQIRSTVTDKQERRQQIMAVLTPDQKQKLMQLLLAHRDGAQSGTN